MHKSLFRDKSSHIDPKKDLNYIIVRVLNFGDFADRKELFTSYSRQTIESVAQKYRYELDSRTRNYLNLIYDFTLPISHDEKAFLGYGSRFLEESVAA